MKTNCIGTPGQAGFGVGVAPRLPAGFEALPGTQDVESAEYGNYRFKDGSVMVYIPRFDVAFKDGAVSIVDSDRAPPEGAHLARMSAFFNGGKWRDGFFVDKYICSKNGAVASSIKGGRVLSSYMRNGHPETPFSSLGGDIEDNFAGAFDAAKTRGYEFFVNSLQMRVALGMLVVAQHQAGNTQTCKWLESVNQWPVGCNDWALGDKRYPGLKYEPDGTWDACGKTGSANIPAAVSHNGQDCGVMDLNGLIWEIQSGAGERDGHFSFVSDADALEDFHLNQWRAHPCGARWPASGGHFIDPTQINQDGIFDALTDRDCGAGRIWVPERVPKMLCVLSGGDWGDGPDAGVWALYLSNTRGTSDSGVGFRAASFL